MAPCLRLAEAGRDQLGCYGGNEVSPGDFKLGFWGLVVVSEDYMIRETKLSCNNTL